MGFLSDLVMARDLIRDAVAGVRELNSALGQGAMAPLSPGGSPFGPPPGSAPGAGNPLGADRSRLQPLRQAATLLAPNGQPISLGGFRTMSTGGGSGGGGSLAGAGGGSGYMTMSGGSGGGGGAAGGRLSGTITSSILTGGDRAVVGTLERIAMELRGLRNDQQRDVTGLRAKGLT